MTAAPIFFALIVAAAVLIYLVTGGFDLGVGMMVAIAPRRVDRDAMIGSIGSVWYGNAIWLVLAAAMLLAAFPASFAPLAELLWLPLAGLVCGLLVRGLAFASRRQVWAFAPFCDVAFSAGSALVVVGQGFALGAFVGRVGGLEAKGYALVFLVILGVLCAAELVGLYALLGAGWLIWRTEGATRVFGREIGRAALILIGLSTVAAVLWMVVTGAPVMTRALAWSRAAPLAALFASAVVVAASIWLGLWGRRLVSTFGYAAALLAIGLAALMVLLWPDVAPNGETVTAAAGDRSTLQYAAFDLFLGLPFLLAYLWHAHHLFGTSRILRLQQQMEGPSHAARRPSTLENDLHLS